MAVAFGKHDELFYRPNSDSECDLELAVAFGQHDELFDIPNSECDLNEFADVNV